LLKRTAWGASLKREVRGERRTAVGELVVGEAGRQQHGNTAAWQRKE
jgi:hypothetical protein